MKTAITFAALVSSLALLYVFSDHRDMQKHKGAMFGMPGGAIHYILKANDDLHIDKAQIAAINAQLPIINKRTSLSGEGEFIPASRKASQGMPIIKVHNIVME